MSLRSASQHAVCALVACILTFAGCHAVAGPSVQPPTLSPSPTALAPTSSPTATPVGAATRALSTPAPDTPTPAPAATATRALPAPASHPTRILPPPEPISLPPGFGISVFAADLRGPRMMALGPDGALYVAERGDNRVVRLPDRDRDGIADGTEVAAQGLSAPSSIAFHPDGSLYVGETERVLRLSAPDAGGRYTQVEVIVNGLPPHEGHHTRTVLLAPDGRSLYVSVGSSCNVCIEQDPRRAAVVRYALDGSNETIYASGLRNAVGITFRPGTGELWATNNGRDWLGDDLPPETIYVLHEGDDAGWPRCHSGRIVDPEFGTEAACDGVLAPAVEMQAHSAPLGLAFYTARQFPEAYWGDLFVAFHGSWNRSDPTGYRVVHVDVTDSTPGAVSDFAAGWLHANGGSWGRPVDVLVGQDGSLYVSDDSGGRIYRIYYAAP